MKLRKVAFMAILAICLIPLLSTAAFAAEQAAPIDVMVNDTFICLEARPYMVNDTVYVPVRSVLAAFGISAVYWESESGNLTVNTGAAEVSIAEGEDTAYVNGQAVSAGGTLQVTGGRGYLPARFLANMVDAEILWDGQYQIVKYFKDGYTVPANLVSSAYTMDDLYWLGQIVSAESKGEPVEGQIAVANVILNRVASPQFPNTVYDVIFDQEYGVQFSPVSDGSIYAAASQQCIFSAKRALNGENYAGQSLYFLNPALSPNAWAAQNRPYYTTIANHAFYL